MGEAKNTYAMAIKVLKESNMKRPSMLGAFHDWVVESSSLAIS